MKRRVLSALLVTVLVISMIATLASCGTLKLAKPLATLDGDTVRWERVPAAIGYEISVNGEVTELDKYTLEYKLGNGDVFTVRAIGNGTPYVTSDWSDTVKYEPDPNPDPDPSPNPNPDPDPSPNPDPDHDPNPNPDPDPDPDVDHVHTNGNGDTLCDSCGATVVVIIDFYSINDLHGKFCDTDAQPGVDELAAYLKSREEADDNVVLLSAGDMWQGSAESNLTFGAILTEWMNELGFVSMTLGNHEYDWGSKRIKENAAIAEFPFLAINVFDVKTNKLVDYCAPSVMINEGGVDIGIIGAIGDCYSSIASDMVEDVYFKTGSELTALVREESERLRSEGAEVIVYVLHDGYGSNTSGTQNVMTSSLSGYYGSTLSSGGYVDLVFEGHTHKSYVLRDTDGVYHLQGGGENKGISHVEIGYDLISEEVTVRVAEFVRNSTYSSLADDPATEELEDKYGDIITDSYATLGYVSRYYSSGAIADVVAELYLEYGLERWGDEYDIVLGGGFIQPRSPYELSSGYHTYADVLSIFPFDNRLALCSISGSKLESKFIGTSNSSYHCAYSDYGNSIIGSVNKGATYYVIVDTYTALYKPNGLTVIDYYDDTTFARDLLARHIADGKLDARAVPYTKEKNE